MVCVFRHHFSSSRAFSGMTLSTERTPGVHLPNHVVVAILGQHVAHKSLQHKVLFHVKSVSKTGHTSDWAAIAKHQAIISDFLDAGGGMIMKSKQGGQQLQERMVGLTPPITWRTKDIETSISWLRCMMQTLLMLRRDEQPAPRRLPQMQVLVDKIIVSAGASAP